MQVVAAVEDGDGQLQEDHEEAAPGEAQEQSHGQSSGRCREGHGEEAVQGAEGDGAGRERDGGRVDAAGWNPRLRRVSQSSGRCDAAPVEDSPAGPPRTLLVSLRLLFNFLIYYYYILSILSALNLGTYAWWLGNESISFFLVVSVQR